MKNIRKRSYRILLIEDDVDLNLEITQALEKLGYIVHSLTDPANVKKIMETNQIDLIVSCLLLPHKNGIELIREIKQNSKYKDIPYLVFSNISNDSIVKQTLDAGALKYISKNLDSLTDLIKEIGSILGDSTRWESKRKL